MCYRDAVMKSVPDVQTLISLRQQLIGGDDKEPTRVDTLSLDHQMRNLGLSLPSPCLSFSSLFSVPLSLFSLPFSLPASFVVVFLPHTILCTLLMFAELYEGSSLLCLTLTVLRGYQAISPLVFVQVDFNVTKLLPSTGVDKMTSSDINVLTEALQILLESPLGSLKWKQLVGVVLKGVATS